MKFHLIGDLPDRRFFNQIDNTEAWHRWEDKSNKYFRIISRMPDPWRSENLIATVYFNMSKDGMSEYPSYLSLKIRFKDDGEEALPARFVRELVKGNICKSDPYPLFLVTGSIKIPNGEIVPRWITYAMFKP